MCSTCESNTQALPNEMQELASCNEHATSARVDPSTFDDEASSEASLRQEAKAAMLAVPTGGGEAQGE